MASTDVTLEELEEAIRNVPDFPQEGIQFKDITPVLGDARLLDGTISHLLGKHTTESVDVVAGIDARGFIFGAAMASWGSTPLFHMVGITPECRSLADVGGEALDVTPVGAKELTDLGAPFSAAGEPLDVVVFAAPQLSLVEMGQVAALCE